MTKEFNPTHKDLLFIENLILEIKNKKRILVRTKIGLQTKLSTLQNKYIDVKYLSAEFESIKEERLEVKSAVNSLEIKIKSINDELSFKNQLKNEIVFHIKHNKNLIGQKDLDKVVFKINLLKKKYADFAKDRTRISSLRIMASEIIEELEKIIT